MNFLGWVIAWPFIWPCIIGWPARPESDAERTVKKGEWMIRIFGASDEPVRSAAHSEPQEENRKHNEK